MKSHVIAVKVSRYHDQFIVWDMGAAVPIQIGTAVELVKRGIVSEAEVQRATARGSSAWTTMGWWSGPALPLMNRYLLNRGDLKGLVDAVQANQLDKFTETLYDFMANPTPQGGTPWPLEADSES